MRNEERFIEACLLSLCGMVDEVVLVDTGSTDNTLEIVREVVARRWPEGPVRPVRPVPPVRVERFAWCDDFSAARNHALGLARHEWILYIDADERLSVPDVAAWRAALADASRVAWKVRLHPRVGWTAYEELRIFRNDERIRFEGEIHERVHPAVAQVCAADGVSVGALAVALQHVGYEDDQTPKLGRNIPLLRAYLAREPARIYCWWHLGEQYRLAGDAEAAADCWAQGVEVIRSQPRAQAALSDSLCFISLITHRAEAGLEVADLLAQAQSLYPRHHALNWMAGKLALGRGELALAREYFEALAALAPPEAERLASTEAGGEDFFDPDISYNRGMFTHVAQESLALVAFRAGDYVAAAAHYGEAAKTAPLKQVQALRVKAALAAAKLAK